MFFGGTSGINYFTPDEIYLNTYPPEIFITSYKLSTQSKEIPLFKKINELKITTKDLPIMIKMAALSFTFSANNHYKVLSADENNRVIHLSTQNYVHLDSLREGKNRFLIYASNNDQTWSKDGVSLIIVLSTPIFRSWFFFTGLIVTFVFLSWIIYRQQYRKGKRKFLDIADLDISLLSEQFALTKREQQIVILVLEGKSNKEIENELYISNKTVKAHLYNIYRKLKVKNRLQLMNVVRGSIKKTNQINRKI